MNKNIDELVSAMSNLKDNGRIPTLNKHCRKNYKEAAWRRKGNTIDWYFEYKIEIDNDNNVCLHIYEALHKSQMHESINDDDNIRELYESIMKEVAVIVKRAINEIS